MKKLSFKRLLMSGIALTIGYAFIIPLALNPAFALEVITETPSQGKIAQENTTKEPPVFLQADEVNYDETLSLFIAKGNVELMQEDRILLADTLSYSQINDTVTASGNVQILEPSGDVMFAEYAELTNQLATGTLHKIRILMQNNARVSANGARKISESKTEVARGVYSPCDVCKEDPERSPLWQIKADKIVHDKAAQTIEYYNSWMEIAGLPIAYSPYFQHPDPSVERSSGLLPPSIGSNDNFGSFLRVPYFVAISEDKDLTVDPIYTVEKGFLFSGEYRQAFDSGDLIVEASFLQSDDWIDNNVTKKGNSRWHIASAGSYEIDDTWRWGFDLNRQSDRQYMDRYSFWGTPGNTLDSQINFEGSRQRNHLKIEALSWQDLRAVQTIKQPLLLPHITYAGLGESDQYGGRWSLDASLRGLKQKSASKSLRTSAKAGYGINKTTSFGLATSSNISFQSDLYKTNHLDGLNLEDGYTARFTPRASILGRIPFYQVTESGTQIIEPMAGFFASPNGGHDKDIRNDDSLVVEQDEASLFSDDMSPGIDRMETGTRFSYGLRLAHYFQNNFEVQGTIAQAYRFSEDALLLSDTGIDEGASDYFGSISIRPNDFVNVSYSFRLDQNDFNNTRNETQLHIGKGTTSFSTRYTDIEKDLNSSSTDIKELNLTGSVGIDDYWKATGYWLHDLKAKNSRNAGLALTYEDECFIFSTNYVRDFTLDGDKLPSDSIMFKLTFKTLGEIQ